MLKRVNSALFTAPLGTTIRIVAEARDNNGVNDARFEYGGRILARQTILGLPGCSFTVDTGSRRFQAGVVFSVNSAGPGGTPPAARYDLFEVENGVMSGLQKSVKQSDSSPLIGFAIQATAGAGAGAAAGAGATPATAGRPAAAPGPVRKAAKKAVKRKKAATRKKTARKAAGTKPATKKTARTKAATRTPRKRAR